MTERADPLLVDHPGHSACLLGNEAIVRGAVEAGVGFACGYPGTPSSEVTDAFARIAPLMGIPFEYSVNEKVAIEMAFAASLAGARAIVAMKHLGLMYAGDPISTIPYVGVRGGLLIVSAGDPSCRTSPNEQDQRSLGPMLHIPIFDPRTPEQAHEMARFAFDVSEASRLPVILRPTTRVCHTRAVIAYGPIRPRRLAVFRRDPQALVPIPANARRMRVELPGRLETARAMLAESGFFEVEGRGTLALVAGGAPAALCADLIARHGLESRLRLVSVGCPFPLPERELLAALDGVERVLVVEELAPFLEDALSALCARHGRTLEVLGKRSGHLPWEFEYTPTIVAQALHQAFSLVDAPAPARAAPDLPPRPPILCPACPHRSAFFAARSVFGEDSLFFNDIGCYTLGYGEPHDAADALLCMGAGFTLAAGVSRVTLARCVGFMGDSTFFHSGMPALLNAVKEAVPMVAVILDNQITAMTGFQESPSRASPRDSLAKVSIEGVVRALGVSQAETVDAYDMASLVMAFTRARDAAGVSVVVVERACPMNLARESGQTMLGPVHVIDQARCRSCGREFFDCANDRFQASGDDGGAAGDEPGLRRFHGFGCQVPVTKGYERHMALGRALDIGADAQARPPVAPCSEACPLALCVQGYTGHIAAGEYAEAFEHIFSRLPLPASVCRVCHRPCEAVCVRATMDEPVAINDLKRFVVEWADAGGETRYQPRREPPNGRKIAVVGAGPAGLAAAQNLALRGYAVTMVDANDLPGGLLRYGIPAFRLPPDAVDRDVARILDLGVVFRGGMRLGREVTLDALLEEHDAVFLAIGASRGAKPGLESVTGAPPVVDALEYLRSGHEHNGRSATGRRVVVIGGGNAAIDAARVARRRGAGEVTVVYRRTRAEMPALAEELVEAEDEHVVVCEQHQPLRLVSGGIECLRTEPGAADADGRRRPVAVPGSERVFRAHLIISAIGQSPDRTGLVVKGRDLDRDSRGCLVIDESTCATSHERIFAGGDLVWGDRTVTDAIAWGQRAAWGIDLRLRGVEAADRRPPPPKPKRGRVAADYGIRRVDRAARQRPHLIAIERRCDGFDEVIGAISEPQARREAARCAICGLCGNCRACIDVFGCPAFYEEDGRILIDPALCNGCAACADICPNGAIGPAATDTPVSVGCGEPTCAGRTAPCASGEEAR